MDGVEQVMKNGYLSQSLAAMKAEIGNIAEALGGHCEEDESPSSAITRLVANLERMTERVKFLACMATPDGKMLPIVPIPDDQLTVAFPSFLVRLDRYMQEHEAASDK